MTCTGLLPPVLDLHAEVGAVPRVIEGAAVGQRRTRRQLTGRTLRRLVPAGIGVVQTHFRTRPETGTGRRPGRRHGELAQLARAIDRIDLIVTQLADQLELFGKGIAGTPTDRQPVLVAAIRAHVFLVDELHLAAQARGDLPVEELDQAIALVVTIQAHVAGVTQTSTRTATILQGEFVLATEEVALHMLRGERPATVGDRKST